MASSSLALPPAPACSFASDNASGVHPSVLEAIGRANTGHALAYGADAWTERAIGQIHDIFGVAGPVVFTWGGTGANVVGLQCLLAPFEAVICPDTAHINVDECGAPERFTGSKLIAVPTEGGKLRPEQIEEHTHLLGDIHHVQPRVVSITQSTEMGTLYSVDEIAAIVDIAHRHGMKVHLDGARLANAAAALGVDVRRFTVDVGVDVLTLRRHQERDDVRRGGRLPRSRARAHGPVRAQAGRPAAVEDALRQRPVRGPAHRRPLADQRRSRQRHGPAPGRSGPGHPRRRGAAGARRSTACSSPCRRPRWRHCRRGRSSGSGTRPSPRCGG